VEKHGKPQSGSWLMLNTSRCIDLAAFLGGSLDWPAKHQSVGDFSQPLWSHTIILIIYFMTDSPFVLVSSTFLGLMTRLYCITVSNQTWFVHQSSLSIYQQRHLTAKRSSRNLERNSLRSTAGLSYMP
jgi:hypothetical protein